MRTSRAAALLLGLVVSLVPPPAPAAAAAPCNPGVGIGLVEFPRDSSDPRARSYIVDHVKPGATFSRRFQVCNGTRTAVTVSLYPVAATVEGGSFTLGLEHAANELSSWIAIEPATLTVAAGARAMARATISVPADAESAERYAVIVAERPGNPQQGIPIGSRVGIRVYLDVGAGGAAKSDFVVDTLQAGRDEAGSGQITAQVHNTGKRALDFTGSLTLRDGPAGQTGGPFVARLGTTLAPGETEPVLVPVDAAISGGPWTAQLTLRAGVLERRVEAALTFPEAAGAQGPPVDVENLPPPSGNEISPLRFLLPVALVLLVVGGFVLARRRRARSEQAAQ